MKINILKQKAAAGFSLKEACGSMVLVDTDGSLLDQSTGAESLIALWQAKAPALIEQVQRVREDGIPVGGRVVTPDGTSMWVAASLQGKAVLLVAQDTTSSDHMMEALVESRRLLRSLLDLACHFAFEVDASQRFTFVTPATAFGLETEKWLGQIASKVFWPDGNHPARNPFAIQYADPGQPVEVTIGGETRKVVFSVAPVLSEEGEFSGVKGACRDVTERVSVLQERRVDSLRLSVQQNITRHLNATENAQELLDNASAELLQILRADLVWSIMKYDERIVPAALCGEHHVTLDFEAIWNTIADSSDLIHEFDDQGRNNLAIKLQQGENCIGMVLISRDTSISPWSQQELQLLEAISDVLTAAFSKAQLIDRLYRLSGRDDLTGLLNRRALVDVVERRLALQQRSGKSGCLMFIDLDNFKEVNDTLGHDAGDAAIKLTAEKLMGIIRSSDVAGRYGGDEFVVWLEGADPEAAQQKAKALVEYMPEIRKKLSNENLRLGASVGVCASVPGVDLHFTDLTKRADAALYEVKKTGKNNIAIAEPPASPEQGQ